MVREIEKVLGMRLNGDSWRILTTPATDRANLRPMDQLLVRGKKADQNVARTSRLLQMGRAQVEMAKVDKHNHQTTGLSPVAPNSSGNTNKSGQSRRRRFPKRKRSPKTN